MTIELDTPAVGELNRPVTALREWQSDEAGIQLHPGDLGWFWRFGADATAAAVRTWSRAGRILAVGLLDGPGLLRMTIAPDSRDDEELAQCIVRDVSAPQRGVLPTGRASVEAPQDSLLQGLLGAAGWGIDEPWTPLRRDLGAPVPEPGLRIELIGPEQAHLRTAVHRESFPGSTFTDERWQLMAGGPAYADARCLVAFDDRDNAVAAVTVWSAGTGRPGLIEPLGAHRDHRGHGHGTAMSLAAAAALRELSSSSVMVCTPSSNVGAVATYASAGFQPLPEVRDRRRDT